MENDIKTLKPSKINSIRKSAALWFYKTAAAVLLLSFINVLAMWLYACWQEAIPDMTWGENTGNHGPWRHRYTLRFLCWSVLHMQWFALNLAMISFVLNPKRNTLILSAIVFFFFLLFMYSHYWLID